MKRFTSMFLAVCMLALPVSGCSQSPGAEASTSAASTASGDAAEEMITLTYWDGWADAGTEPTAAAVTYALEEWEKENPDIQIVADHTTSTSGAYKTKIKTALSSGEAPDVFLMDKGSFAQPYIDAGKLLELDSYLSESLDGMKEGVIETASSGGKIYGVPFNMHVNGIYCNTELFESNNISYPTTWEELIDVCRQFSELGITPIAMGNKELWQAIQLFEPMMLSEAGYDYCLDAINRQESFDCEATVKAANIMLELAKSGAFSKGAAGLTFTEGAAEFAQGTAAMTIAGTWGLATFEGDSVVVDGKVKIIPFPRSEDPQVTETVLQAGPYEYFAVNPDCAHPQEAVEFAVFMSQKISDYCYQNGLGLPVWDTEGQTSSELFQQALDEAATATRFMSGWDFYFDSDVTVDYMNLVSMLLLDQTTAEDFAKQLQQANTK